MHGDAAHYCTKTEGNETIAGESDKETFGSRLTGDENMAAEGYGRRNKLRASAVQDNISQHFRPHCKFSIVVNQSHCPEFVHEVRNTSTRRAHHLRESFMTQYRDFGIRRDVTIAQPSKFQENASQALFAMVEELIAKVLFQIEIADQ